MHRCDTASRQYACGCRPMVNTGCKWVTHKSVQAAWKWKRVRRGTQGNLIPCITNISSNIFCSLLSFSFYLADVYRRVFQCVRMRWPQTRVSTERLHICVILNFIWAAWALGTCTTVFFLDMLTFIIFYLYISFLVRRRRRSHRFHHHFV